MSVSVVNGEPDWERIEWVLDALDVRCPVCHSPKGVECHVEYSRYNERFEERYEHWRPHPDGQHKDRETAATAVAIYLFDLGLVPVTKETS